MRKRETVLRSRARLLLLAGVLSGLVGACGQQQAPAPALEVTSARATSNTSVIVTFSAPVDSGSVKPEAFAVRAPSGSALAVLAAFPLEGGQKVALTTAPQQLVSYELKVRGVGTVDVAAGPSAEIAARFSGSDAPGPMVAYAVPLTNTSVLVAFADPVTGAPVAMGEGALEVGSYAFEPAGLQVYGAAHPQGGSNRAHVVLTTSPQGDLTYTLTAANVMSADGERLLDPFLASASFHGIASSDGARPVITAIAATSETSVAIRFSEPVTQAAANPTKYRLQDPDGSTLPVVAAELNGFGTEATIKTWAMTQGVRYTLVALDDVEDLSGNPVDVGPGASYTYTGTPGSGADLQPPRVLGANAVNSTTVVVTFSEPVYGAEDPTKYAIVDRASYQSSTVGTQAVLLVESATVGASQRSVTLRTRQQSEILYALTVTDVTDAAGNHLAPPDLLHPFQVTFMGKGVSGSAVDSDGDGLSDAAEQAGWTVTVRRTDGGTETRKVTSDPDDPDTDGDGIGDADERYYLTDPRSADTDGDGLTDYVELSDTYSEPTVMDTDGDGLNDGLEVNFFGTSPLLEDTDGDQFSDDYEIGADNRNPRVADLPRVEISVGSVDLRLDVRFEETTATGTRELDSKSAAVTLAQSQESARSSETSTTLDWFVQAGGEICFKGGCEDHAAIGGKLSVEGGASGGSTTTFTNASVNASQREYATTLTTEAEFSAEASVTRVVEGATMAVEVSLANASNIAFTISDIEVTALIQDPADPSRLVPVATLFAASDAPISIGPLTPERGPFRFVSDDAFPALVESLMANPRGLVFRIANYEITDEFGRNFAFVEQDVNDRTAFLEINYAGNLDLEHYLVATNSTFDDRGRPMGITMREVLEDVLGLEHVDAETDENLDPNRFDDAELLDRSFSTREVDGITVLYRVKRVSPSLTGSDRSWWVLGPDGNITPVGTRPGRDFLSYRVFADQDYAFAFVQDLDEDDLEAIEELLYRTVDSNKDTDGDGIDDADEVYGPFQGNRRIRWLIRLEDGRDAYSTMSHPGRVDSDGDGLTDCQELLVDASCATITVYEDGNGVPTIRPLSNAGVPHAVLGTTTLTAPTDPSRPDTDGDGLTDLVEVIGFAYVDLAGQPTTITFETRPGTPYATNPLSRDTDRDGLDDWPEVRLGSDPTTPDGDTVRDNDADGLVNAVESAAQRIVVRRMTGTVTLDVTSEPNDADTDDDGLTDWEEYFGCLDLNRDFVCDSDERFGPTDRRNADTDGDGLTDRQEVMGVQFPGDPASPLRYTDPVNADTDGDGTDDGTEVRTSWVVTVEGRGGYVVWSDPLSGDKDGDDLSDTVERQLKTDPNESDTDGDGALDGLEAQPSRPTSPLVPDHLVTVTYQRVAPGNGSSADSDGDDGSNPGDFWFTLELLIPTASGGLQRVVVANSATFDGGYPNCANGDQSGCWAFVGSSRVIQLAAPHSIEIGASRSFAVPFTSLFSIEGVVQELDDGGADYSYYFGGLGDQSATFSGDQLTKGSFPVSFLGTPEANRPIAVMAFVRVE